MSSSIGAASSAGKHVPPAPARSRSVRPARVAIWGVIALDTGILIAGCVLTATQLMRVGPELLTWSLAVAVVGVAAIQTPRGPALGLDMPVLLAAGYLLGPIPAGIVALAGYVDTREFRGEISGERALFNRAQTSLSVMAATAAFSLLGGTSRLSLTSLSAGLVAVAVDSAINYSLIAGVMSLHDGVSALATLGRLRFGSVATFSATYSCYGLLSVLLAEVNVEVGPLGLLLFAIPLLLARQALASAQRLEGAERRVQIQRAALGQESHSALR